ncbi:MAG: hypothetical protein IKN84_07485 [Bacteroidales bacterium]|jgi:hypothetical protein|nr:hypothetical protein [Bacteroidales bacterium]
MNRKLLFFATLLLLIGSTARAQQFPADKQEDRLKGPVKTVLTTVRTPQGRVVGQPVRNYFNRSGYYSHNIYYDTIGNPVIIVSYTYDKKNRLLSDTRTHEPYSELLSQTKYIYDKKKRTITAEMFGIADSLEDRTVYQFDKNNRLLKTTDYDVDSVELASITYKYNDFGYVNYTTYTEGKDAIYKGGDKFRYDTDGIMCERCSYYLTTLRQAFLYTYYYDEHGNWTQAYVYHVSPSEGYLYQIITREITYYE